LLAPYDEEHPPRRIGPSANGESAEKSKPAGLRGAVRDVTGYFGLSRYGAQYVSPRLDEDVDELRRRIEALEARIEALESDSPE
jgi:hypothetical protein